MSRICKNCGAENRDNAQFCNGCGVPLPKAKSLDEKKLKEIEAANKRFWMKFFTWSGIAAAIVAIIFSMVSANAKIKTAGQYESAYLFTDNNVFLGVTKNSFGLEGVAWGMGEKELMKLYEGAKIAQDPDFRYTLMVSPPLKTPLPHANFMNLGLYMDKLYAVKFEFGASDEPARQQIKVPNKEFIMYGRYLGLNKKFKELFGDPFSSADPCKALPITQKVAAIKRGELKEGVPSNIYTYWILGNTRAEIALFGYQNEIKLTVRFFYIPVYEKLAALSARNSGINVPQVRLPGL